MTKQYLGYHFYVVEATEDRGKKVSIRTYIHAHSENEARTGAQEVLRGWSDQPKDKYKVTDKGEEYIDK